MAKNTDEKPQPFGWCMSGDHDRCRVSFQLYGRTYSCGCEDPECEAVHGTTPYDGKKPSEAFLALMEKYPAK